MSVNLLPWRQWQRARRNRAFWAQFGATAAAAVTLVLVAGSQVGAATDRQLARNEVMRQALANP